MAPFREPSSLVFDSVANFRDLGGHTTRDGSRVAFGRLFRSGHLANASAADVAVFDELGLRKVFDFRTLADIKLEGPDQLPEATRHTRLPMPDPAKAFDLRALIHESEPEQVEEMFGGDRAVELMREAAATLVRERADAYRQFLAELADADAVPALFHCSAGKDRAGWAGSLVLLTLGVDEDQVIEQYLLSNRNVDAIRESLRSRESDALADAVPEEMLAVWEAIMQPFLEVRREYIAASFDAMHEEWGTFDRYLHEGLAISESQRERLRELLLE